MFRVTKRYVKSQAGETEFSCSWEENEKRKIMKKTLYIFFDEKCNKVTNLGYVKIFYGKTKQNHFGLDKKLFFDSLYFCFTFRFELLRE